MRVLGHKGFQAAAGQLELIGSGATFVAEANATNSFKDAIDLTENEIGPSDSVVQQQPAELMGRCEQIVQIW